MAKLWPSVSVLLVLVMLLFLAPALILLPGQNVSAQGDPVTEEIEATFSFSVDSGGNWYTFKAGSGGVQGTPPRLALVQYTRPDVILSGLTANLSGCGFRNYTTGSGSVASTVGNLNGTMTLEWITVRFNMTYNHTPKYNMTATNFGWMMGRGHYYDVGNTSNNFTFVVIADLDCNGNMTVAAGKGFMESVEENGRFGSMANPPEDRNHIIGDFHIALSSGTYTGNFSLRNYPPNEVYDEGMLNVTGGVLQENTDAISNGSVEILNMTLDGPMSTPPGPEINWPVGFEEIDWGKDPIKTINSSQRLGVNGTMDISRNTILYLNQSKPADITWVTIQANPACVLHINDTYTVTGDDDSPYGELWELLLLAIPWQVLPVNQSVPNYFGQAGYTFTPFGTVNGQPNASTGCYAGTESFANATIFIQAVVGTALQHSFDYTYGLFPTPKVESVFPSAGVAGTTMKVKITGKYFLRAAGEKSGFVPNSGSVSFGPNITVDNYTITSSPVDDAIIANITIAGGAAAVAEDVTVTSCFGYNGTGAGSGIAPYESGVKIGGFTVVGTGATLEGHITFVRKVAAPCSTWITPLDVRLFEAGNPKFEQLPDSDTTNNTGVFVLSGLAPGTYDIGIKNWTCLSKMSTSVTLTDNATTVVNFGTALEGDCNHAGATGGDRISFDDYIDVLVNYGKVYFKADFDRSGLVGFDDYITVLVNYGKKGDIYIGTHP